MLHWMRSVEKIPSIPGIMTGLVELAEYLRKELGPGCAMWELGSFAGESAEIFARYFIAVHCVDPWQDPCGASSIQEVEGSFDERARIAGNMIKHKMTSERAAETVENASVDFVYIDAGAHTYGECYRDIGLWFPKVKRGGFLGGHDWEIPELHAADVFPGVERAVRDYFGQVPETYGLKIFSDTSWVLRKP